MPVLNYDHLAKYKVARHVILLGNSEQLNALFAMETQVPRSLVFQDPCFLQSKWLLGNYLEVFTRTEQLQKKQDA